MRNLNPNSKGNFPDRISTYMVCVQGSKPISLQVKHKYTRYFSVDDGG